MADAQEGPKPNRIQISSSKKPLFFYVNLAKRMLQNHDVVELSALGLAVAAAVAVSEILKNNNLSQETLIQTSTTTTFDDSKGHDVFKAKIEIHIKKSERFDEIMAALKEEREALAAAEAEA